MVQEKLCTIHGETQTNYDIKVHTCVAAHVIRFSHGVLYNLLFVICEFMN